jgi:hypothetical protein
MRGQRMSSGVLKKTRRVRMGGRASRRRSLRTRRRVSFWSLPWGARATKTAAWVSADCHFSASARVASVP